MSSKAIGIKIVGLVFLSCILVAVISRMAIVQIENTREEFRETPGFALWKKVEQTRVYNQRQAAALEKILDLKRRGEDCSQQIEIFIADGKLVKKEIAEIKTMVIPSPENARPFHLLELWEDVVSQLKITEIDYHDYCQKVKDYTEDAVTSQKRFHASIEKLGKKTERLTCQSRLLAQKRTQSATTHLWIVALTGALLIGAIGIVFYFKYCRNFKRIEELAGKIIGAERGDMLAALQKIEKNMELTKKKLDRQTRRNLMFLKAIPHMLFHIDGNGVVLDMQGERNYGLTLPRAKLIGKKISQLLAKKIAQQIMRYVRETLKSGLPQVFDGQLLLNGRRRNYKTHIILHNKREVLAVVRETTEQKQTEAKLKTLNEAMEQRVTQLARSEKALEKQSRILHSVLDSIGDGMIVVDKNGTFLLVNPAAEEIMGVDLMGSTLNEWAQQWECYMGDATTPCPWAELPLARAVKGQQLDDAQLFLKNSMRPMGLWLSINARPLKDVTGSLKGGVVLFRDITERKQAEEALLKSEAKNRALLNAIPDLMLLIKVDGTFLGFTAAKNDESGITSQDIVGQKVEDVFPREVAAQIMHYALQAINNGCPQIFEYQLIQNGELCDYEARLVVGVEDEALAIVRDITERKKVERMKNEFISTVSHELRTPLTSIRGSLGLIVGGIGGRLSDQGKNLANIALNNTERLVRLINDILDIQKIESGKMAFEHHWLKLTPLIEQAIESNRSFGEQFNVEFAFETSMPNAEVKGDCDRLMQVITNLLSNAAKFSPHNDKVKVKVINHNESIRVFVIDHGPGIPPEFHNRIFQKFAQADSSDTRKKGGTGLGLSIAKSIIERHGGKIGFTSEVNVGSTFYFDLPEWRN